MKLTIEQLEDSGRVAEIMASFGKPMNRITKEYLMEKGLDYARVVGCMKWIWFQWLQNGSEALIRERVASFVADGMQRQKLSPKFRHRPRHDLLLLHCAVFASRRAQLLKLAERVVDASGFRSYTPRNDGELYTSAWCGAFKYWILGDREKAVQQAEIIWGSYRPPYLKAASQPLATPWLKQDWNAFVKAQKKDFEKLWSSGRKNGTVRKQTSLETIVTVDSYPVEQLWCWAHCGMALLAYRQGVQVVTDPFWFPPHALKCLPIETTA